MKLQHTFRKKYKSETIRVFEGVTNWLQFNKNLKSISNELSDSGYYDYLKAEGDIFEVFIEGLIYLLQNDNRVNISEYKPVRDHQDNGVDGYGLNSNGEKSVIQIKYKTNPTELLTAGGSNLDSMFTEASMEGILPGNGNNYRHIIFTSGKGLARYTEEQKFRGKVKCYGIKEIRSLVDNNIIFWDNLRKLI